MKATQKTTSPHKTKEWRVEPLTVAAIANASVSVGQIHSVHL